MPAETYRIYALKYATREAKRIEHFLDKGAVQNPDAPMPMDYYVWLVENENRTLLVDTGFSAAVGSQRGRQHLRSPAEALKLFDVDATQVEDVILTHMHYDHSGTTADFPKARVHLQERELDWVTGNELFRRQATGSFETEDVVNVVRRLYDRSLVLHDGPWEFAPGISVHHLGGHTPGIQVVRVRTERGNVVLASDATHYYENMETAQPFATTHDADKVLAGFRTLNALADASQHIIPGHDPLVMQRYPAASKELEGIAVRLDAEPK